MSRVLKNFTRVYSTTPKIIYRIPNVYDDTPNLRGNISQSSIELERVRRFGIKVSNPEFEKLFIFNDDDKEGKKTNSVVKMLLESTKELDGTIKHNQAEMTTLLGALSVTQLNEIKTIFSNAAAESIETRTRMLNVIINKLQDLKQIPDDGAPQPEFNYFNVEKARLEEIARIKKIEDDRIKAESEEKERIRVEAERERIRIEKAAFIAHKKILMGDLEKYNIEREEIYKNSLIIQKIIEQIKENKPTEQSQEDYDRYKEELIRANEDLQRLVASVENNMTQQRTIQSQIDSSEYQVIKKPYDSTDSKQLIKVILDMVYVLPPRQPAVVEKEIVVDNGEAGEIPPQREIPLPEEIPQEVPQQVENTNKYFYPRNIMTDRDYSKEPILKFKENGPVFLFDGHTTLETIQQGMYPVNRLKTIEFIEKKIPFDKRNGIFIRSEKGIRNYQTSIGEAFINKLLTDNSINTAEYVRAREKVVQ